MAKGGGWGQYAYNDPSNLGGLLSSILQIATSQGKGWGGKSGGRVFGGGLAKGKGKSKGQGKGQGDWGKGGGTDGKRPEWMCEACAAENRMGRVACRICWAPRPKCFGGGPNEKSVQSNSAVGADGRKPLLGVRGENWKSAGGKGTLRATAAGMSSKSPNGAPLPRGGGTDSGRGLSDKDGYTVVNYKAGSKPRVLPSELDGGRERDADTNAGKGQGNAATRSDQEAQPQSTKGGARREWYDIEDGPEVLYEEWIGEDNENGEGQGEDEGEDEHEDPEGPTELEQAEELVQIKKEMHAGLRDRNGKGHATTKKAWEELQEAQEWWRQVKGPRPWVHEANRLQRQKSAAEKAKAKVGEKMVAEKAWYAEITDGHEERMEGLREKWDEWREKVRELDAKLEEIRRKPQEEAVEEDMGTRNEQREATSTKMRDITSHITKALEEVDGNEKAKGVLGKLRAQIGELEGLLKPSALGGRGGQRGSKAADQRQEEGPKLDEPTSRTNGKGGKPGEEDGNAKGGGKGPSVDVDRNDQNAQHKWARRSTRRGREEGTEQGDAARVNGDGAMEGVEGPTQESAAERGAAETKTWEMQRQRILDKIRGRLQQEKNRKAAELQAKAIEEGAMPEPHMLSKEQMDACQRRLEETNREVDEEAEREFAAMSKEQLSRLLEEEKW